VAIIGANVCLSAQTAFVPLSKIASWKGEYHHIQVSVDKPETQLVYREGYYARSAEATANPTPNSSGMLCDWARLPNRRYSLLRRLPGLANQRLLHLVLGVRDRVSGRFGRVEVPLAGP
jgi:hypothetical protein